MKILTIYSGQKNGLEETEMALWPRYISSVGPPATDKGLPNDGCVCVVNYSPPGSTNLASFLAKGTVQEVVKLLE